MAAPDRQREHARRLVEAGHGRPVDEDRLAPARVSSAGESRLRPIGAVESSTLPSELDQLGEGLAVLDQRALRRGTSRRSHERGHVLATRAQILVEGAGDRRDARVDEPAAAASTTAIASAKDEREPDADRQAAHDASSRSR